MTPTPMNKNLSQFLESEKKEVFNEIYDNDVDNEYRYKWESWITAHDSRLIAHLREMIKSRKETIAQGLVYLASGFPPEKQWEASEAHADIIITDLLSLLTDTK